MCIEVKVMKEMEFTETTRKLGKYTQVWSWSRWSHRAMYIYVQSVNTRTGCRRL